jgi:hypothetical protein
VFNAETLLVQSFSFGGDIVSINLIEEGKNNIIRGPLLLVSAELIEEDKTMHTD